MPALSLMVCLYQQRDLLERLLRESQGCYDDLVVVHDGPDETGIRAVVEAAGGRFFEQPRAYQQEPHIPFALGQARHDWVLHFDADEFPSTELKAWLKNFRQSPEPVTDVSGYTCIWPVWDGTKAISQKWPTGRDFLFNKQRVRFFGMVEQGVVPDGCRVPVDMILCHQPKRKSHGLYNVLMRKQAYRWRERIARSLLGKPTDLPCWRWEDENWPLGWEQIRRRPLWTALKRLIKLPLLTMHDQWKTEGRIYPFIALNGPVYHACLCIRFWRIKD